MAILNFYQRQYNDSVLKLNYFVNQYNTLLLDKKIPADYMKSLNDFITDQHDVVRRFKILAETM